MSDEDRYNHLVELCQELLASDKRGQEIPFADALKKIKREVEGSSPDRTPGPEDVGRWVKVRNGNDEPWRNIDLLRRVDNDSIPFVTGSGCWKQARIVPGVGRVTMQPHDGSAEKPDWLADEDELLIEYQSHVKAIRTAREANWKQVYRYQKLEIK